MADFKTVTVEQIFNALKQNGFQHLRGTWTAQDIEGVTFGACVLGQAAINLGVVDHDDNYEDNLVTSLNGLPTEIPEKWYTHETDDEIGSTIIYWNDLGELDDDGEPTGKYHLKTYQEVVNMAYDILSPLFSHQVTLKIKDWKIVQ